MNMIQRKKISMKRTMTRRTSNADISMTSKINFEFYRIFSIINWKSLVVAFNVLHCHVGLREK